MAPLLTTLQHRPYVVAFLLTFLILSTLHLGFFRTMIWLAWGYFVAFSSEFSSIHNGFPYGLYHYKEEAFAGELAMAGVPVWDSISYPFIAYASYATAWFLAEPHFLKFRIDPHVSPSRPMTVCLFASILMMLADMIIDPVSILGGQWFLGDVYFYPHGGIYFGVPISNFLGWFLVACIIIFGFQIFEKLIFAKWRLPVWGAKRFIGQALLGPFYYFGILGFMLVVTFWIKAYALAWVSSGIASMLFFMVLFPDVLSRQKREFLGHRR